MARGQIQVYVECPFCKSKLSESDLQGRLALGLDNSTVTVDLRFHCKKCDVDPLFTYIKISDMVNLKEEVSNG